MPRPKHSDLQIQERIAARVRQARAHKGWTQEQLAEVLDVATETISRYEVGHVPPSLPMLSRMADAFGVDIESLIGKGPTGLTPAETELIEGWRSLDIEEQSMVLSLVRRFSEGSNRFKPAMTKAGRSESSGTGSQK